MEESIRSTTDSLRFRSTRFRNLIVLVVAVSLLSGLVSIIFRSGQPLWGLALLVPLCGAYLYLDAWLVGRWQQQLWRRWAEGKLDVNIFMTAITTIPSLPQKTLGGMLAILPGKSMIPEAAKLALPGRAALARTARAINRCQRDRLLMQTVVVTVGPVAVCCAIIMRQWWPMVGLLAVPLGIFWAMACAGTRFVKLARELLMNELVDKGNALSIFMAAAEKLDWTGVSKISKKRFLTILTDSGSSHH